MARRVWMISIILAAVALANFNAYGSPGYLADFNLQYGTSGTVLNSCSVCHTSPPTRNPYGAAFLSSGYSFTAIEPLDSDGDGFSNITEINARTFPGDPASKPAASDTTLPTVTAFTIPSTSSTLAVTITSFTATDNVGVTGYMATESATKPAATVTGWTAAAPTSYTFATAGAKTLYGWAKDAAGNVSNSLSASVTVTAPVTIPGAPTPVSPSGAVTNYTPTYTWNALANASDYYLWVNDSAGIRIQQWYTAAQAGCAAGTGTCSATPTTAVAAGAGQWWIQARNAAGTGPWSAAMSFAAGTVATGVPIAATLVSPSGTITTNTPAYSWNAVSNSTWYYLWVNDSTGNKIMKWYTAADAGCAAGTGTCSVTSTTVLAAGAGQWWIQTWNSNAAGPWSAPKPFAVQSATADTTRPTVTAFSLPATSSALTVPITAFAATDNVGVTGYQVTESVTVPAASAAAWSATAPASYTFATTGTKTLYAWAKDAAGNVSASRTAQVTVGQQGTPTDMTFWVGKWFSVTEKNTGYSGGSTGLRNESGTYPGYLKIWGWDQNTSVLNADRYEQDPTTGQWSSESFTLHYIGGSRLDFLVWCEIGNSQTDPTSAFSARISGTEQEETLTATFSTLGGYYQETSQQYRAGNLTITGNVVPASQVPVPANILVH